LTERWRADRLTVPEDADAHAQWRRVRAKVLARRGNIDEAERLGREAVAIASATSDLLDLRAQTLADLGSGAGLPGIPLAIAAPGREILLVDSNGKKARFLREAARHLQLAQVRVAESRVEAVAGEFDCVTARAFATLADMLAWGGHLLGADGRWLALKGRFPHDEIDALPAGFEVDAVHRLDVPGLDAERHLVTIRRSGRAADARNPP
jgi:16S rRNA (guanine527-N7)-methyltransferase